MNKPKWLIASKIYYNQVNAIFKEYHRNHASISINNIDKDCKYFFFYCNSHTIYKKYLKLLIPLDIYDYHRFHSYQFDQIYK